MNQQGKWWNRGENTVSWYAHSPTNHHFLHHSTYTAEIPACNHSCSLCSLSSPANLQFHRHKVCRTESDGALTGDCLPIMYTRYQPVSLWWPLKHSTHNVRCHPLTPTVSLKMFRYFPYQISLFKKRLALTRTSLAIIICNNLINKKSRKKSPSRVKRVYHSSCRNQGANLFLILFFP